MTNKLLLNNKKYSLKKSCLPCFITYKEKTGGSQISISIIADLFLNGSKILFITAYPAGKDNFIEQIGIHKSDVSYVNDIKELDSKNPAIIIESGNEFLFLEALEKLDDIEDRIIFVKNIETFSDSLLQKCLQFKKIIISGDINNNLLKDKNIKSIITFNESLELDFKIPKLPKYKGYFHSEGDVGFINTLNNHYYML